jgi:hypothetical protein
MYALLAAVGLAVVTGFMGVGRQAVDAAPSADTAVLLARAHVWSPTDVSRKDLLRGPDGPGSFTPGQVVSCQYSNKKLSGASPKFACVTDTGDELKVKYGGGTNGEVYAEVAASRLLWAMGFAADRMYAVRVVCRGCPDSIGIIERANGDRIVDPATVERKTGYELSPAWDWRALDDLDAAAGGASLAHRDALKLLAAFLQHSDSKPDNQRIVCLQAPASSGQCERPFLMIQDLGVTFGRANPTTQQPRASANLHEWAPLPVWKDPAGCIANLAGSWQGTLKDPVISEAGRQFLAELLAQVTDAQLHDMFTAARVTLRPRQPTSGRSGFPAVTEWVQAFHAKRSQIINHQCGPRRDAPRRVPQV